MPFAAVAAGGRRARPELHSIMMPATSASTVNLLGIVIPHRYARTAFQGRANGDEYRPGMLLSGRRRQASAGKSIYVRRRGMPRSGVRGGCGRKLILRQIDRLPSAFLYSIAFPRS